jgi:hypothetical protein
MDDSITPLANNAGDSSFPSTPTISRPAMQKRSLVKLALLSLLTLGFYEIIWLSETRQEMISKFGVQIPSFRRFLFIMGFQVAAYLSAIILLLVLVPHINHKISTAPDNKLPSQQCEIDYAANRPVSQGCKDSVTSYWNTTSPKQKYSSYMAYTLIGIIAILLSGILSGFGTVRWMKHYAAGVQIATYGKLSQFKVNNFLMLLPPTIRILAIQYAFNNAGPINSSFSP